MDADELALRLDVNLFSRGACWPCLGEVAHNLETWKRRGGELSFLPTLWAEGLGQEVMLAVATAKERGLPGAEDAQQDLAERRWRSAVFRAVVRRLAHELRVATDRARAAALN